MEKKIINEESEKKSSKTIWREIGLAIISLCLGILTVVIVNI